MILDSVLKGLGRFGRETPILTVKIGRIVPESRQFFDGSGQ
jgi:hypothetical protein